MKKYCGVCGNSYYVDGFYSQCWKCGSMCPESLDEVIVSLFKEVQQLKDNQGEV